jgi:hypothetical protein
VKRKPPLTLVETDSHHVPSPPPTLGEVGRRLWVAIQSEYNIGDSGGVAILAQACAALDRAEACAAAIVSDGMVVFARDGSPKEHPLLRHENASRSLCCRLLVRLGLDVEPTRPHPGRPSGGPGIGRHDLEKWRGE